MNCILNAIWTKLECNLKQAAYNCISAYIFDHNRQKTMGRKRKVEGKADPYADAASEVINEEGSISSLAVFGKPQRKENAAELLAPYGSLHNRCVFACYWSCSHARTHARLHVRMHARVDARTHARTHVHAGLRFQRTILG